MVVFSVLYPATDGATFDKAYYDATHIPLVKDAFQGGGLTGVRVLYALPGAPGPYVAMADLEFESMEALQACLGGPRSAEVMADVANFTTIQPITQISAPA